MRNRDRQSDGNRTPKQRSVRAWLSAVAICGLLTAAGCSSLAEADEPVDSPSAWATAGPVTAATTCAALTEPSSLAFNAPRDLAKGVISAEERDAQLFEAKQLFAEIAAPPGPIERALAALNAYLDHAPAADDGGAFDSHAFEYANLDSNLAQACEAAGEELIIEGHGG